MANGRGTESRRRASTSHPLLLLGEVRAVVEAAALVPTAPLLARAPRGEGRVLVIPPFGAGDGFTTVLRRFLARLGYETHKWDRNEVLGLHRLVTVALVRLEELRERSGEPLTLIGHSLGGIYAREIARAAPDAVRQVITVGSPFAGDLKSNYVWPMYEVASGTRIDAIPTSFLEQLNEPPPVPVTAIFSKSDGVASWWCCVEQASSKTENIEVVGSHVGLLHNPVVLSVIAERLAQRDETWQPLRPSAPLSRFARIIP
jgi:pimeloyl-ACP methyl ester carboxylesterase